MYILKRGKIREFGCMYHGNFLGRPRNKDLETSVIRKESRKTDRRELDTERSEHRGEGTRRGEGPPPTFPSNRDLELRCKGGIDWGGTINKKKAKSLHGFSLR